MLTFHNIKFIIKNIKIKNENLMKFIFQKIRKTHIKPNNQRKTKTQ